jgi:hypothetical protein
MIQTTMQPSENGRALIITLDGEYRAELLEIVNDTEQGYPAALNAMIESRHGGATWKFINAEDCGALTDSPLIAEEVDYLYNGEVQLFGRIAWFPDYCVRDEWRELAETGRVEFPFGMDID